MGSTARVALADDPPPATAKDFDANHDGKIDLEEFKPYLKRMLQPEVFGKIDTDHDGKLSEGEIAAFTSGVENNGAFTDSLQDFQDRAGNARAGAIASLPVQEVDRWRPLQAPEEPKWSIPNLYLRKSYDAITLAQPVAEFDEAVGAQVSYERTHLSDQSKLSIDGALIYVKRLWTEESGAADGWKTLTAAPSVTVERLRDESVAPEDRPAKSKNVFTARTMVEAECGPIGPTRLNFFRVTPGFATDSRLESKIYLLDGEWEPIASDYGIGTKRAVGAFDYSLRARLAGTLRHISDRGLDPTLDEGNSDFHWGPKLDLSVALRSLPQLGLAVSYAHLQSPENPRTLDRTEITLKYDLNANVAFSIAYVNGFTLVTLAKEKTTTIGLSVKF